MNIQYCFRKDARITGVDPDDAAKELARIHGEHGVLTPETVLAEAEDEDSPLHDAFEWNDQVAAHHYRKGQAQNLIYSVRVIREDAPPEPVYIYSESSGGYLSTQAVVTDASLYEEAYCKALGRIGEAEHSLRQLEELAKRYRPEARTKINRAANAMLQVQRALHEVA